MLIPENVPLHDFEPTVADYVAFMDADLFFYHGLNLEPWVEVTMDALGNDAPTAIQTHAMPSGEVSLDYESILIEDLCETMSDGPYESVMLANEESHAGEVEIHAERVAHSLTIPEDDEEDHDDHDDHDDHGHDDHDDHDDDGHDDQMTTTTTMTMATTMTMVVTMMATIMLLPNRRLRTYRMPNRDSYHDFPPRRGRARNRIRIRGHTRFQHGSSADAWWTRPSPP